MATIQVQCVEHDLAITNVPLITSGSIGVDFIQFSFCPKWTGYEKTVVFMRDGVDIPPILLDDSGICEIPPEAIFADGEIKFGVFGIKDGRTISSEVLEYKINVGSYTLGVPLEPSADIYTQISEKLTIIETDLIDVVTATQELESYLSTV